jgi:hypothetical protein
MHHSAREVTNGTFLVLVLNLAFSVLLLLGGMFGGLAFFGILQFFYLVPVTLHFRQRQRLEVVKGISIGAMITIFINGVCSGSIISTILINTQHQVDNRYQWIPYFLIIMTATIGLMVITFYGFNGRKSTADQPPSARDREP